MKTVHQSPEVDASDPVSGELTSLLRALENR
jgi:hypothetical protein